MCAFFLDSDSYKSTIKLHFKVNVGYLIMKQILDSAKRLTVNFPRYDNGTWSVEDNVHVF
jgi:hypothetical protein